jgi:ferrochelatase
MAPFDAVLLVAFGGPQGREDIRPFLANVLRGRRVSPERVAEVAAHYERFDGVSPLTAITHRQADGLRARLLDRGVDLPVYVGMRNWDPLLPDVLRAMARRGVLRAIGFICAPHRSYSSCGQYRENVADACAAAVSEGVRDVTMTYVGDWHTHDNFIEVNARNVAEAFARLPQSVRGSARIVFTAHSLPVAMPGADVYRAQLLESASLVAARLRWADWAVVFQSRSGRPEDQWLEPDVCRYLHEERMRGLAAAVLCPIGFICDHIEVLHDLDHEAAQLCTSIGLPMARARTVNDDPDFLEMMADVVLQTWDRYRTGRPLPLARPPAARTTGRDAGVDAAATKAGRV